jgi:hypothetical protein
MHRRAQLAGFCKPAPGKPDTSLTHHRIADVIWFDDAWEAA